MPVFLDALDVAIIKSFLKDGKKSFREISRETGITTPTVKARFNWLVNVRFLKFIIPIFDFSKIDANYKNVHRTLNQEVEMIKDNYEYLFGIVSMKPP